MVKKMFQQVLKNIFNLKHCASRSSLRGCHLLRDRQKRGMSTKDFFSGKKRNGTISLKFFLVLGEDRKRAHVVGKGVIKRVSRQTGRIRCIKPQYSEGTYFMDGD